MFDLGFIPIGNLLRFLESEPQYVRNRFKNEITELRSGFKSFEEGQKRAFKILNDYFDYIDENLECD